MRSGFNATSVSIEDLFVGACALVVPDYQRPYAWTTREAQQLLDDLLLSLADRDAGAADTSGYFLGSVLLMTTGGGDAADGPGAEIAVREYQIVDGQQRLITLTILLSVLRDLVTDSGGSLAELVRPIIWSNSEGSETPRIQMRGAEQTLFRNHVLNEGAAMIMPEDDDLPAGQARIVAVREHLVQNLVDMSIEELTRLAIFVMRSCHVALITTNSIDRAHRIFSVLNGRGRPLARNDILKARILGGIASESRAQFVPEWDRIERQLGNDFESLFSHIRTIEGHGRERVISGIGSLIKASGGAEAFFRDVLVPYASIYEAIQNRSSTGADQLAHARRHITYLGWLGSDDWVPAMMRFWRQSDGHIDGIADFAKRLERLAYGLRLLGLGAEKRQARFNAVLKAIRNGNWRDAADSPLEFTREEVRNIQYNLRNLHGRSQLTCKLVLMRLNEEIGGRMQDGDPASFTVEHVLPQKPGRNSHWRSWFPSPDEREKCTQSIGNLILVTRAQNDRARNLDLPKKLEIYFSDGPEQMPSISRGLYGAKEWCATQILDRERRLLTMIQELWNIETLRCEDPDRIPKKRTTARPKSDGDE